MAMIVLAVVKYEHHEVHTSKDGTASFGQLIDQHIAAHVATTGDPILQVHLELDPQDGAEQARIREMYAAYDGPQKNKR